eukprot:2492833-Rhodomonas_salina.2
MVDKDNTGYIDTREFIDLVEPMILDYERRGLHMECHEIIREAFSAVIQNVSFKLALNRCEHSMFEPIFLDPDISMVSDEIFRARRIFYMRNASLFCAARKREHVSENSSAIVLRRQRTSAQSLTKPSCQHTST